MLIVYNRPFKDLQEEWHDHWLIWRYDFHHHHLDIYDAYHREKQHYADLQVFADSVFHSTKGGSCSPSCKLYAYGMGTRDLSQCKWMILRAMIALTALRNPR